jgi:urate oxidase
LNKFASGPKKSYYGKGDVIVYRLNRDAKPPAGQSPVFGTNVMILIYGDAFWPTYTTGDNSGLIATDSMKNFIQRETMNFDGSDLESYCRFLAEKFLDTYPQATGAQLSARDIPYSPVGSGGVSFSPGGPDTAFAQLELARNDKGLRIAELRSGISGFRLLRLNGSAFKGFVRDQYTTLPDIENRPLHMWLDLDWTYTTAEAAFSKGAITGLVRRIVHQVFDAFQSGSIQQIIHQIGALVLEQIPAVAEIHLEANNRTWDTIVEQPALGVYTDARPPYGCLGVTMQR